MSQYPTDNKLISSQAEISLAMENKSRNAWDGVSYCSSSLATCVVATIPDLVAKHFVADDEEQ